MEDHYDWLDSGYVCFGISDPGLDIVRGIIYTDEYGRQHFILNDDGELGDPAGRNFRTKWVRRYDPQTGDYKFVITHFDGTTEVYEKDQPVLIIDRRGRTKRLLRDADKLTVESGEGRQVIYDIDTNGRTWRITDPLGNQTTLDYGTNGDLVKITDAASNAIEFEYDGQHRIIKETLKNGVFYTVSYTSTTRTIFDSNSNAIAHITSTNGFADVRGTYTATNGFTPGGTVVYTDANGEQWTYHRDKWGRITQVDDPVAASWDFVYGTSSNGFGNNRMIEYRDRSNRSQSYQYDKYGNVTSVRDADSNAYAMDYDTNGLVKIAMTQISLPGGKVWTYAYDTNGDLLSVVDPLNVGLSIDYTYEDHPDSTDLGPSTNGLPGRIKKVIRTDRRGNDDVFEYDTRGNLTKITRAYGDLDLIREFDHDGAGHLIRESLERGDIDVVTRRAFDHMGRLVSQVVDSNGLAIIVSIAYDAHGKPTTLTDANSNAYAFDYDHRNRLTEQVVADGDLDLTTTWTLDGNGNVTNVNDPANHNTVFGYNKRNELIRIQDAEGYIAKFQYDAAGNVTKSQRWRDVGTSGLSFALDMDYDLLDRLVSSTVAEGTADEMVTSLGYESPSCTCATAGSSLPHKIVDPGGKNTYIYYDELDRISKLVRKEGDSADNGGDGSDSITTFAYDAGGNLEEVVGPEDETTEFTYDEANRRIQTNVTHSGGNLFTFIAYDGANNVTSIGLPNGNNIELTYDGANRLIEYADSDSQSTYGKTTLTYDGNGNLIQRRDGELSDWYFQYDEADRLKRTTDAKGEVTLYLIDAAGNLETLIDAEGIVTEFEYDDINRLIKSIEDFNGSVALKRITETEYDGLGNVLTLTAYTGSNGTGSVQTTSYTYDHAARIESESYPDDGGVGTNGAVAYTYYPAGTVETRTDQNQVVTTYVYDDLHRLTQRSYSGGAGPTDTFAYDKTGRLTTASNSAAVVTFNYDDIGRLDDATLIVNSVSYTTDLTYNVPSRWRQIQYSGSGPNIKETYTRRGLLDDISNGANDLVLASIYDHNNRLTSRTFGNGMESSYSFDDNGWLTEVLYNKSTRVLEQLKYGYDKVGNVKYREVETPGREHLSEIYQYDNLHRLSRFDRGTLNVGKTAIADVVPKPFAESQAWKKLDMLGNWLETEASVDGAVSTDVRTANAVNEYLTRQVDAQPQVTLIHDDNGNLTDDGTQLYTYDPENRLTRVNRKSDGQLLQAYEYDALGRRVHTINSNGATETVTTHVYAAGPACLVEYDSTASEGAAKQRWFVHGQSFPDPLLMVDSTGMGNLPDTQREYLYYMKDMLGSVTGLVDEAGNVVERYTYDPYGRTEIAAVTFYHDHDLDGDIDASDVAHYDWCTSSGFPERAQDPMCVFVHNRDGDYELTSADGTLFAAYVASPSYNSNGAPPPEEWERLRTAYLDANNDQVINLYDWYAFQVCEGVTTSTGGMNDHLCLYLFDLDGDDDVDLNEGQQGCNLFTGQWSTAGDGRPGQATGSRFGNPFMWTGQRYDAPVGLYHFLFRSYSPTLGRWLQRDPLGYVDSPNLLEYVRSGPPRWIDAFGDKVRLLQPNAALLKELQKLYPSLTVDESGNLHLPDDCAQNELQQFLKDIITSLINDDKLLTIRTSKHPKRRRFIPNSYDPALRTIYRVYGQRKPMKNRSDGSWRYANDWEILWHEFLHAYRHFVGIHRGLTPQEEEETIALMNELRTLLNEYVPEDDENADDKKVPERDEKSHSEKPPDRIPSVNKRAKP